MRKFVVLAIVLGLIFPGLAVAGDLFVKQKDGHQRGEASADSALVYFFRPATMGAAIKSWAFVDEEFIGVTRSKGYVFASVPAGTHTVWAKAENTSALELNLEAGKTYYFKKSIRMGIGKARVKLDQIDESEAMKYFDKCSYCEPTDEGRSRAAEIAGNRLDKAEANADKRKNKQD